MLPASPDSLPPPWPRARTQVGSLNRQWRWVDPRVAAVVLCAGTTVAYLQYTVNAVNQIADYLGIRPFVLKKAAP